MSSIVPLMRSTKAFVLGERILAVRWAIPFRLRNRVWEPWAT